MTKTFALFSILLLTMAGAASASYLDFTAAGVNGTNSGFMGTGFFIRNDVSSTGTGVIDSFVQIAGNNVTKQAFNTTVDGGNGLTDNNNGSPDNFNHALLLSDLTAVLNPLTGVSSYRFLLDINENSSADRFLSLDDLEIWRSTTANPATYAALTAGGTNLYDMTPGANPTDCRNLAGGGVTCDTQTFAGLTQGVLLDYTFNHGSGSGDMFFYLPVSAFAAGTGNYIYLYSQFGLVGCRSDAGALVTCDHLTPKDYRNSDGFEEWARVEGGGATVPEPGYLLLLSLVGVPFILVQRRRQRNNNVDA
jgi:hypothetical protein